MILSPIGASLRTPLRVPVLGHRAASLDAQARALFPQALGGAMLSVDRPEYLYQANDTSTPVTGYSQPVGRILDQSGKGTHFGQSTTTSRPMRMQDAGGFSFMQFDGADDFFVSLADVDYTGADTVTTFACVQLSASVGSMIAEHSSSSPALLGGWTLYIDGPNNNLASRLTGASQNNSVSAAGTAPIGVKLIAMMEGSFAAPAHTLVGSQLGSTNTPLAEAYRKLAKALIYLGARGGTSLLLQGRLYAFLQMATLGPMTASQKVIASRWVGSKGGV